MKVEDYIRLVNYTVNASSLEVVEKMKGKEFNKENVLEVLKTTISESNRNVQGLLAKIGNSLLIESKRDKIIQNHGGKR